MEQDFKRDQRVRGISHVHTAKVRQDYEANSLMMSLRFYSLEIMESLSATPSVTTRVLRKCRACMTFHTNMAGAGD